MSKNIQKLLCDAIRTQNLMEINEEIDNGGDIHGSLEGHENITGGSLYQNPENLTTIAELAVYWAHREERNDILIALHKKGLDFGCAIKAVMGDPQHVSRYCNEHIFTFIHDYYPTLYGTWNETFTLLMALENGQANDLEMLIRWGQDVNIRDENGMTLLMKSDDAICSKTLLEGGIDQNAVDYNGNTAIWHAIEYLCDNLNKDTNSIEEQYGANVGILAKEIGIDKDPNALLLSEKLLAICGNIDTNMSSMKNMPDFKVALHQAKTVISEERMKKLEEYMSKGKMLIDPDKKNNNHRF